MAHPALSTRGVRRGVDLLSREAGRARWRFAELSGRLVELSGAASSAALTLALGLVREAQLLDENAAWVTLRGQGFYAPDAAAGGVDLEALAVVRVATVPALGRAADHLLRSGAFGLVVVDLPPGPPGTLRLAELSRLLGLAQKHDAACVFLTQKARTDASLGSLVSLRGQTACARRGDDAFACTFEALKDKRGRPGWRHEEVCHGPPGLH